ncbi:MAG TPA: MDR family MFS transporter [Steroidobacteraceae bacterium]|jgi:DHA2 family multidrug resistance protein|nr:MDR family MFS transporter [Steroidobacteraceae bacterium]
MNTSAHPGYGRPEHRAMISVTVMSATILTAVDSTIANVALPHMQGSLSATQDQMTWALTSYIIASAVMTPLSGWLADRFGRKAVFLYSVIGFTVASVLCGLAQTLPQVVLFRLLQGLCGASLFPLSQAVLFDIYPMSEAGRAMAIWGIGVGVGPMLGPIIGGWLTDNFSWRWVFYVNVPIGALAVMGILAYLPETTHKRRPFDFFGYAMLAIFVGMLQMVLDRGPRKDWFGSTEIQLEAAAAALALYLFAVHTATAARPFIRLSLFKDRNYLTGSVIGFLIGMVIFSVMSLLAPFLQDLMHYSVLQAGYLLSTRSIGTSVSMMIVGRLMSWLDARLLIAAGLILAAFALWQMTQYNLLMDRWPILVPGVIMGFGLGSAMVPSTAMAFGTLARADFNEATALYALVRNLGNSIGIAMMEGLLVHNMQTAHSSLVTHITPFTRSLPGAGGLAVAKSPEMLNQIVTAQAQLIAYIDDFKFLLIALLASLPLLLFVRRPDSKSAVTEVAVE